MSFNNVAVIYVKRNTYRIYFWYMSKDDVINIMNGSNLGHKKVFQKFFLFFLLYIKDEWGYWFKLLQKNGDVTLNRANNIIKIIKRDQGRKQEINIETYLKKKKIKKENLGRIDIVICLKKRNKD